MSNVKNVWQQHKTKHNLIMETEKIISTIKTQVGTTDFSDRTIGTYVELNPIADGQEPDENYFSNAVKFVKSMQGQFNADFSTKLNAKVDEFKKNYNPSPKPFPNDGHQEPTNGIEERLKAIEDGYKNEINTLKESLTKKEKILEQKSYTTLVENKFKNDLEEKGLVYDPIYFEHIVRTNGEFDTEKSVDDAVKIISEKYDKMFKDRNRQITSSGFVPDFNNNQATPTGVKSLAEQFKERMIEQGRLPSSGN